MAKECSICGKKLGFFEGKIYVSDGVVCDPCWIAAGLTLNWKDMSSCGNRTVSQLQDMIEIEVLKREAEKTRLKQEIQGIRPSAASTETGIAVEKTTTNSETPSPSKSGKKKTGTSENSGKSASDNNVKKPVDIVLSIDRDRNVDFRCLGHPVINLDDLIQGNEMIIGDGYVWNESKCSLPDVRILCEFEPAIIDPGILYYPEGTLDSVNGKFEIEDPPVNLEEYAKIKRTRNGKVRFTLLLGEQQLGTVECAMKVKPAPVEEMQKYMNAVMYETEKNASGPVNVFLYAREDGTFEEDLLRQPDLLYAMYANGQEQLIGDVYVKNDSGKKLKNIQFRADFTSDILAPVDVFLGDVPAREKIVFEVDDPAVNPDKLARLTEIETCTATYTLIVDGRKVSESIGRVTICPYDQWNGALVLLPAFMTPNHPEVIQLLQQAAQWLQKKGKNPSLEGYQGNPKRVEEMVEAVYNAILESDIIYSNPPASFFGPQRIRLSETVMQQKFATCMDITILFASCLESFGLHPVLITAPSHIFAGVWLTDKGRLSEPVIEDTAQLREYIRQGKLVALECTDMTVGKTLSYRAAKKDSEKLLKMLEENKVPDQETIDVQIVRNIGIRPIPMRRNGTGTEPEPEKVTKPVESVEPKEEAPTEKNPLKENITTQKNSEPVHYQKEDYTVFDKDLSEITIDNFYDRQTKRIIKDAIAEIVQVEGPISQPALIHTLISNTGLGRASKNISEHLDKLVAAADVKITRQSGVRFLWNKGSDPAAYTDFRFREQRNPEDICKYELKNAVCYLLQEKGPMTREEITRAMVEMMGYSRSSHRIEECAAEAIKVARELKAIEQNEDKQFILK